MAVATGLLRLETEGDGHVVDLTPGLHGVLRTVEVGHGIVCVFATGSTAAVTTMELEPGGVQGLRELLTRLAPAARPQGGDHAQNVRGGDAHAQTRASLLGPSVCVPLVGGRLVLGTRQQVVLVDFDDRPRRREVHVQIVS